MGTKEISFDEQLQIMENTYGVDPTDAKNVFEKYKDTISDILTREAEAKTKEFEIVNPYTGLMALKWKEASTRVDVNTGKEFNVPGRYIFNYGIPGYILDTVNKNIDFSSVPSKEEIKAAKAA